MTDFFHHFSEAFQLPLTNPVLILALMLFIILLAPVILRKFKIPGIIGLIIAGVLIGPRGFNILENNSSIQLFSTIGLLYIMFLAGLDLDMNGFKTTRHKSILFGLMTFAFPLLIGYPICRYLLQYDFAASLLISIMFSTHTLVSYPIVSKFGISKNKAVAITVGGTILTDTLVLAVLAIVLDYHKGTLNKALFIHMGVSLAIFSLIMFWLIPKITKWFFRKLESEKHSHYIFVLVVVFFAAFLAEMIGLEPIIGAFVSGLVLNRFIPHSSTLMNRIDFIGNALFIPFFLISVGMLVDLSVLVKGPEAIIVTIVLSVAAFSGKWIAAFLTQLFFRFTKYHRRLIFGLSSSHAAATLAIVLAGYQVDIINDNVLNGTILLILITCTISSLVTERAARKIKEAEKADELPELAARINTEHILVPVTENVDTAKLLDFSILLKDKKSKHPISLLSVVPFNEQAENHIVKVRNSLEGFINQGSSAEVNVDTLVTIDHNMSGGIARMAHEIMADTIVIGWPKKTSGTINKLMGDTLGRVIQSVEKNIFVCSIERPLIKNRRILLLTTPFAELEAGFESWLFKLLKLSNELSIPIDHFGDRETEQRMRKTLQKHHETANIRSSYYHRWDDFSEFLSNITNDDLVVLVSSRQGFVSYVHAFEQLTDIFTTKLPNCNKIAIYPQQTLEFTPDIYDDISGETITTGWKFIRRAGKKIWGAFK